MLENQINQVSTNIHFEPNANDNLGRDLFLPNNLIWFSRSSSSCCFFLRIASSFCLWSSSSSRYRSSSRCCRSRASLLWASSILLLFSSSILSSSSLSFRAFSCKSKTIRFSFTERKEYYFGQFNKKEYSSVELKLGFYKPEEVSK